MHYKNALVILILTIVKDASGSGHSIVPAHAPSYTSSISHLHQASESPIVWDPLTQQHMDRLEELKYFHDPPFADYVPPDENGTRNLSAPQKKYMDHGSEMEKSEDLGLYQDELSELESQVKSRLEHIESGLQQITHCPNGQLLYKGKNVYTADQLKYIEKKAKGLKPGFDYVYLGDGNFVRLEKEAWDLSGVCGKVRAFDSDLKTVLYETGYCHSNWSSLTPGDLTLSDVCLYMGFFIPYKIVNHFLSKYWENVQEKNLGRLRSSFKSRTIGRWKD
ncbi:secreted protein [Melampsora americana]|nr:secreted protein [Melampsora americana]